MRTLAYRLLLQLYSTSPPYSLHRRRHSLVRHSVAAALPCDYYQLYALFNPEFDLATLSLVFRSGILDNLHAWPHAHAYTSSMCFLSSTHSSLMIAQRIDKVLAVLLSQAQNTPAHPKPTSDSRAPADCTRKWVLGRRCLQRKSSAESWFLTVFPPTNSFQHITTSGFDYASKLSKINHFSPATSS